MAIASNLVHEVRLNFGVDRKGVCVSKRNHSSHREDMFELDINRYYVCNLMEKFYLFNFQ